MKSFTYFLVFQTLATIVLSKIHSSSSFYPFSTTLTNWHVDGTNMAITTANFSIESYDFSTASYFTISAPNANITSVNSIITHATNNQTSYCFHLFFNTTYSLSTAYNSSTCINKTFLHYYYSNPIVLKSWVIGNNGDYTYFTAT